MLVNNKMGKTNTGVPDAVRKSGKTKSIIRKWRERVKFRRQISDMPEYLLRDMGISNEVKYSEMRKYFWQN